MKRPTHIGIAALAAGLEPDPIRAAVRTGDTPPRERQAMLRKPPHILVTTPESLYLLLTGAKSREVLRNVTPSRLSRARHASRRNAAPSFVWKAEPVPKMQ